MNRPLWSALFSVFVAASSALACMNDYVPNVKAIERSKAVLDQLQQHELKEPWTVRRDRLRKELATGGDYKVKNDLATSLAHTGEAAEAVTLLEQVETEKPGLYATASNLGTAYELAGNDEKALEWIRKGIERNPNAHERTEWLHVKILEAKLALKSDPNWLDSHSIVDPQKESGAYDISATGNRGETLSADRIKNALMYQLHERLQFVPPPDAVVSSLLLDLGTLVSQEHAGIGSAKDVLELAAKYIDQTPNTDKLQDTILIRRVAATQRQKFGRRSPTKAATIAVFTNPIAAVGILSLLVIGLKRLIQRRWFANPPSVSA